MPSSTVYIITLCFSLLLISFIGTAIIRRIALKYKVLDVPSERSSHDIPTPRGGGLAIVICWYLGLTVLFVLDQLDKQLYCALMTGAILAVISLLDDMLSLSARIRLIVQVAVAIGAILCMGGIEFAPEVGSDLFWQIIVYPIVILGIVWFINLFNFLDGLDGYAALEALFISAGVFIFTHDSVLLVLISVITGFLYWNWPKARIFMGDVGSTQLGFVLSVLAIYFHKTNELGIVFWLMLSAVFWFDATLTLGRRLLNREKLGRAHRKHAYQRLVRSGYSHLKTSLYALAVNILILVVVYIAYQNRLLLIPCFLLIILLLLFLYWIIERKVPFHLPLK